MRLHLFVAAAALLSVSLAARADSTFNLTLTPNTGSTIGGDGTLGVSVPPLTGLNSVSTYTQSGVTTTGIPATGTLDTLSLTIGGETFNLGNDTGTPLVEFTSGMLSDITFSSEVPVGMTGFESLNLSGTTYVFEDIAQTGPTLSYGTVSAASETSTSVTPEPASFILLGTGLLGIAGVMRKRLFA